MKKTYFPSNSTLEEAVLQALENLGGEAGVPAINEELIRILDLPEELSHLKMKVDWEQNSIIGFDGVGQI